ncbi:MAG: nuclease-related domain-containing protein, partial [Bacillota bacterium]|nr:nuclease-related domain-containing protein [Bacillota bacterium]
MKTQRIEELMTAMKSFGKESYHKSELLNEMFALQQEIVELTFSGEHAATAELKIWDVERHLEQLNADCGDAATEELARFKEGCKMLCNLIKAEISGNRGEYKAFKTLDYLKSQNRILKNVELSDGDVRTELDAVVITPKCVTIVEVKNTSKNIFIDEEGNYYRTGEFLKWDSNIAEKMSVKEGLLKKALEAAGYGQVQIRSIVVFTNNRIEVQNKYRQIKTSFVSQLAYIIDGYRLDDTISIEEMDKLQQIIQEAECKEAYPFEFDVNQYKADFANLMATLEIAKTQEEVEEEVVVENIKPAKQSKKATLSSIMRA